MRLPFLSPRVGPRLFIAFATVVALTIATAVASIYAFSEINRAEEAIVDRSLPLVQMTETIDVHVARSIALLAQVGTAKSEAALSVLRVGVGDQIRQIERAVPGLKRLLPGDTQIDEFERYLKTFRAQAPQQIDLKSQSIAASRQRTNVLATLKNTLEDAVDQLSPLTANNDARLENYRNSGTRDGSALEIVDEQIILNDVKNRLRSISEAITSVEFSETPVVLAIGRQTVSLNLRILVRYAIEDRVAGLRSALAPVLSRIVSALNDPGGVFALTSNLIALNQGVAETSNSNLQLAGDLRTRTDEFVDLGARLAQEATDNARQAVSGGFRLVIVLTVLSVVGAVLIVWLYVYRNVVSRMNSLTSTTLSLAAGDLGTRVPDLGRDELGEMAKAIDRFKENAIRLREQEEELIGTNTALKEVQKSLENQADELQRSNQELEQFAYLASHDLQEPLRVVASYCELLEQRYGDRLDDDARVFINYAVDGSRRMRSLIDDLLTYSRVGRDHIEIETFNLASCVDDAMSSLQHLISENSAKIVRSDLPRVSGNFALLTQVFQNLIGNGIKFRSDDPPHIEITARMEDGFWKISVADNGLGIAPEYGERIFRIFQRLHTRSDFPGNGLGLALCQQIIARHSGKIWLETQEPPGATIHFTLPVGPVGEGT